MGWEDDNNNRKKSDGPPDLDEIFGRLLGMLKQKNSKNPFEENQKSQQGGGKQHNFSFELKNLKLLWIVAIGALLLWAVMGVHVINQQERAVVLRLGKFYSVMQPGLRWQPFFIDTVDKVNVTVVRSTSTSGLMLSKDENILQVTLTVQYIIDNAKNYILRVRSPMLSLNNAIDSALRSVVGNSTMNRVLTDGRADVAADVKLRLQEFLDEYQTGMSVVQVNIQNTQAPSQVQEAFDDVIKAREDEQRFRNEARTYANGIIPVARGQAQRILQDAIAYKEKRTEQARGESSRFLSVYKEYVKSPKVTRERMYQETVQRILQNTSKVLVDTNKSGNNNNMIFLPLDKILAQSKADMNQRLPSTKKIP